MPLKQDGSDNLTKLREMSGHLVDPEIAVLIFESVPDAILMVDKQGKIQLVNRQAEIIFGYPRTELFDQLVHILLPESLRDKHTKHVSKYSSDPKVRSMGIGLELTARDKGGEEFPVEINLSPIVAPQGIFTLAVIRKRNIT